MDLYAKLNSCMEELTTTFTSRMAQYEEDLKNASNEAATHKTIAGLSREFTDFKTLVWKTMSALKSQMELLVVGLDRHEMASRSKVLLLHGIPEDKGTDALKQFLNVASSKMDMTQIAPSHITSCHRLGRNLNKPRPILVRFESRILRNDVWNNKGRLKGSGLILSEFLTKPRHEVFMHARQHFGVKQCWTSDGKIVIQVSEKSRRKIESAAELHELIEQCPRPESSSVNTGVANKAAQPSKSSSAADKRTRKLAK